MTPAALARRVGVTDAHISGIERGKSGASVPVLRAIAEALAVSVDVLTGDAPMPDERLHKQLKRTALLVKEVIGREAQGGVPYESIELPVLGSVAAGRWEEAILHPSETYTVPLADFPLDVDRDQAFLLRISGDSMVNAGVLDQDLVLVQPTAEYREGEIVVVANGTEATCKWYYRGDGSRPLLVASNPAYPPLPLPEGSRIIGVVRGVHRSIPRR